MALNAIILDIPRRDTKALVDYCHMRGLMISGGSDCHGSFVPGRLLGVPYVDTDRLYLPGLL